MAPGLKRAGPDRDCTLDLLTNMQSLTPTCLPPIAYGDRSHIIRFGMTQLARACQSVFSPHDRATPRNNRRLLRTNLHIPCTKVFYFSTVDSSRRVRCSERVWVHELPRVKILEH
eukprot:1366005-Rhodomonas_salina.3